MWFEVSFFLFVEFLFILGIVRNMYTNRMRNAHMKDKNLLFHNYFRFILCSICLSWHYFFGKQFTPKINWIKNFCCIWTSFHLIFPFVLLLFSSHSLSTLFHRLHFVQHKSYLQAFYMQSIYREFKWKVTSCFWHLNIYKKFNTTNWNVSFICLIILFLWNDESKYK